MSLVPLYGFLEGDTLGLLLLARPQDSAAALAESLQQAARIRVAPNARMRVIYKGRTLAPQETVASAEIQPLDRIDVVGG